MTKLLHGNEKNRLTGGREPLFSQKELLVLAIPLLVEQLLEVTVGMADTMMVSRCGEAAISGVSLVDMINNLIIVLFAALATGGAVVVSQYLGAKEQKHANASSGQLILLSALLGVGVGVFCFVLARPMIRLCYAASMPMCWRPVCSTCASRRSATRSWPCTMPVRRSSAAWATPRSRCRSAS